MTAPATTRQLVRDYFAQWNGDRWNRFWFTPIDPFPLSLLRVLTGLMAIWFLGGYCFDLTHWLAEDGMLPSELVFRLTGVYETREPGVFVARPTYLHLAREPAVVWAFHLAGLGVAVAFTLGLATRLTNLATLAITLAYVHRAPMLTGQFEPVLCFMLFYLCLSPSGAYLSLDSWRKRRTSGACPPHSWSAGVALRLIQVHVAALYFMMGVTKLAGAPWWSGEAVWWLIAHTESRLIDLTAVHHAPYLFNALTHAMVALELTFPVLIANRWSRPVVLALTTLNWIGVALVTGLFSFSGIMLVANVAYISPAFLRGLLADLKIVRSAQHEPASSLS